MRGSIRFSQEIGRILIHSFYFLDLDFFSLFFLFSKYSLSLYSNMDLVDAQELRRHILKRKKVEVAPTIGESLGVLAITALGSEVMLEDPSEVTFLVPSKYS